MFLPEDIEISSCVKRNASGQNVNLANSKPSIQAEAERSADEDSQSSKSDESQGSALDSSSVATETSSGTESLGDVLQGEKPASSSYAGKA